MGDISPMEWLPAIASILGTASFSAIVTGILTPRSEARRLRHEIAENKSILENVPPEAQPELLRAMKAHGYRLAALVLVRFRPWVTVAAGAFGLIFLLAAGAVLVMFGSGSRLVSRSLEESFASDPFGSLLLVSGVFLAAVAVGAGIAFLRFMLLRTARLAYARNLLTGPVTPMSKKAAKWKQLKDQVSNALFTID
jgi:hypothetical protein